MLDRVRNLGKALGENPQGWTVAFARLRALSTVQSQTWRRLEDAPTWTLVFALGNTTLPDTEYCHDIERLARDPTHWVTPRIADALRRRRMELTHPWLDPTRIQALLDNWPWPQAPPPMVSLGACDDSGLTTLSLDEWGACIELANRDYLPTPQSAKGFVESIEETAQTIRTRIEQNIETDALLSLTKWIE